MPLATLSNIVPRVFTRHRAVAPNEPTSQLIKRSPTDALSFYSTPGIAPPSARIDPKLKVPPRRPPRFWEYWKFAAVAATKATHVTTEVLSHKIWGPRRKSWGIEMTVVTSLIREMERHADLVDIDLLRMVMSLTGFAPLPSDAIVTPVTFHVKRRNLRGILADFDAAETGKRELYGEWVVGRKTWQRLQHDWKSGKPRAEGDSPRTSPKRKERVVLYIHGGAYYLSSAAAQRIISIPLSKWADARVFALDYRLAPETCFPGPLHDAVSAYMRLVDDLKIPPENIIVAGDSAGGGLSLALLLYLRDNEYPLPSGAILMSPWCDLTLSCESWDLNAPYDVVPFPSADCYMNPIAMYLGEHMEKYLTHPYASPLFGDMTGLPPLLIQAGEAEVLRDEITLLAHKATLAGVQVYHELYEDCIHVFQAYPFLDASKQAFGSIRHFVKHVLPQVQSGSPQPLPVTTERGLEKEIESSDAVLVSGDGTEMAKNKERMEDFEQGSTASDQSSDTDDDKEVSPSWIRSPVLNRLAEEDDLPIPNMTLSPPSPRPESVPARTRPRSQTLLHPCSSTPSSPKARPQRSYNTLRSAALAMSTVQNSPPPPPALRRSARGGSHPDLASLVDNWSREGPANHTYLYPANTT
ncbi:esterase [Coprinopsis cinerea okayama7|uniref:Esterase n=1 Tax=Coprinopsis cinerea (strain Okayama-7 / 130 / ATCC MYA-4618 / FGSC 9003) TaxID=240176 RepID=A8N322_COPC7|nr:esterase [Coprinopsis cinerea okayama7\|eukprot:XP_001829257.1 esterase [Coprinopsis cinerea okayama7\